MSDKTALIVEDSPTMRQLITFALRRIPGLSFIEAEDGAQALNALKTNTVDVILLDINMPVMNGFSFLERLGQSDMTNRPPIVMITTEGSQQDIDRAMALGAAAYITKPLQAASLTATVEEVLKRAS